MNSIKEYLKIVKSFLDAGYEIVPRITSGTGQLFIRHDVDVDTAIALKMASAENENEISSVYFIRIRSEFYNPLSEADKNNLYSILAIQHELSLHFDMSVYRDVKGGLNYELNFLKRHFSGNYDLISLHRPTQDFTTLGVHHTYNQLYGQDAKYFSDANCLWRYGYPKPQEGMRTVHLLTHPVWWMIKGNSEKDKCKRFLEYRKIKTDRYLKSMLRTYV